MIIKGKSRSDAAQMSAYLLRDEPGQSVTIVETAFGRAGVGRTPQAVHESVMHFEQMGAETGGTLSLYHAKLNPDREASQRMGRDHWMEAADIAAAHLGMEGQPRVLVLHEKEDGRIHGHVVFQRTEQTEQGYRLISDSHNYPKHERAAREIETVQREIAHEQVRGIFTGRERDESRPGYDEITQSWKPSGYDYRDARQAGQTKVSPAERKAEITDLWRRSDSGQAFVSAAHAAGYDLAQGDKKPIHMLVKDGEAYDLRRNLEGVKKKDITDRLADYPAEQLPEAAKVRQRQTFERQQDALEREIVTPRQHDSFNTSAKMDVDHRRGQTAELDDERRRYEVTISWAKRQRSTQQGRHHLEQMTQQREQSRAAARREKELQADYGEGRKADEERVQVLDARMEKGGFFYRVTGQARRDGAERINRQVTIDDSLKQENEQRRIYRSAHAKEREALQSRHAQERQAMEGQIREAYARHRDPPRPSRDIQSEAAKADAPIQERQAEREAARAAHARRVRERERERGLELEF